MCAKNKQRVFICFDFKYPYQNANSNYIRNFAQAIAENNNFEVIVIGAEQANRARRNSQKLSLNAYHKTKYVNMKIPVAKFPFRMVNHVVFGEYLCQQLEIFAPTTNDYIILYNDYPRTSKKILRCYKNLNDIGHLYSIVVEWFQPYQYRMGRINPDYILWKYNFQKWLPKFRKLIPISTYLSDHFKKFECDCLTVPCLSDTSLQKVKIRAKTGYERYNFAYVGAFVKKDAIPEMIQALTMLEKKELDKIYFHFTAITEYDLKEYCGISENDWEKIKDSVVFHGWMEYEDLLNFYQTIDFLVLARERNVMTLSNFPSKVPEMMAYGIIPVCSDVGDYTELYLVDGKNSIIFQGYKKYECASAIRRALQLSPEQLTIMKNAARRTVEEKLDYHNWSETIFKFLESEGNDQ